MDVLAVHPHPSLAEPLVALNRAYHAWIRTQPQLTLELWDDGLDQENASSHVLLIEPVPTPKPDLPRGGLTASATEPRHDHGAEGKQPVVFARATLLGSSAGVGGALSMTTAADASSYPGTRVRRQKGL